MKLFGLFLVAGAMAANEDVTEFCGQDLHAFYGTDARFMKYV